MIIKKKGKCDRIMNGYFTVEEVADLFDIDEISAEELLNGAIDMEVEEAYKLAQYKGVTISEVARMLNI